MTIDNLVILLTILVATSFLGVVVLVIILLKRICNINKEQALKENKETLNNKELRLSIIQALILNLPKYVQWKEGHRLAKVLPEIIAKSYNKLGEKVDINRDIIIYKELKNLVQGIETQDISKLNALHREYYHIFLELEQSYSKDGSSDRSLVDMFLDKLDTCLHDPKAECVLLNLLNNKNKLIDKEGNPKEVFTEKPLSELLEDFYYCLEIKDSRFKEIKVELFHIITDNKREGK